MCSVHGRVNFYPRPHAAAGCAPLLCEPLLCAPLLCAPLLCELLFCAPLLCAPLLCEPLLCEPLLCEPLLCELLLCAPLLCAPLLCAPLPEMNDSNLEARGMFARYACAATACQGDYSKHVAKHGLPAAIIRMESEVRDTLKLLCVVVFLLKANDSKRLLSHQSFCFPDNRGNEVYHCSYGSHPAFYSTNHPLEPSKALPLVYVYDSYLIPASDWKEVLDVDGSSSIRNSDHDAIVIGLLVDSTHRWSKATFKRYYELALSFGKFSIFLFVCKKV